MGEVKIRGPEYWGSKEAFLTAKENLKNIAVGMNKRKALMKMGGSIIMMDNEPVYQAPGYLRDKYSQQKADDKVVEEFHFGYIDRK